MRMIVFSIFHTFLQVDDWDRRLTLFSRTLDEWMNCQRNWLYLEQIFSNPDIQVGLYLFETIPYHEYKAFFSKYIVFSLG